MYYLRKKSGFNIENIEYNIEIKNKLKKKEYLVFKKLVDSSEFGEGVEVIPLKKIGVTESEVEAILDSLSKKKLRGDFYYDSENNKKATFLVPFFDYIGIEDDQLFFKFSKGILLSQEVGNIYSRVNVLAHSLFRHPLTKEIYKLVLKKNKSKGKIVLSLKELRRILKLEDGKYRRFYDIQSKVLKQIIDDLEVANCSIWFDKIKGEEGHKSKITSVVLNYRNTYHLKVERITNKLIKKYADRVIDFRGSYDKIYGLLKTSTEEAVDRYIMDDDEFFNI